MATNLVVEFLEMATDNELVLSQLRDHRDEASIVSLANAYGFSFTTVPNMWAVNEFVQTADNLRAVSRLEISHEEAGTVAGRGNTDGSCSYTCQSVAHGESNPNTCCD